MKSGRYFFILLLLALVLPGCGDDSASFSLLADSDEFIQDELSANSVSKLDILWVIDNSGSMQSSQTNLAENFQAFIQDMATKNFDYQMAVTTSEAYLSYFTGNMNRSRFRDGVGSNHSGVFVITPTTLNLQQVFMTNITQGISGSGDERAFHSFKEALNNPLNAGFVRQDSFLSVIIVSDEDDFSSSSSTFREDYNHPSMHPVSDYVTFLDQFTNSTPTRRRYNVSAMAIFDVACRNFLNMSSSGRKIGVRYEQLVDATGGIKGSLCGDFASELELISDNILQLATQFYLSRTPIESTIVVKIDGAVVPPADQNPGPLTGGWRYDAASNSIIFSGDYIPAAGSKIKVDFDPANYGE